MRSQLRSRFRALTLVCVIAVIAAFISTPAAPSASAQNAPDEIIDALTITRIETAPAAPAPTPAPTPTPQPQPVVNTAAPAGFPADVAAMLPASTFRWMESAGWTTQWLQGPGPGRQAEARYATRTIVIWRTADRSTAFWAGAFAHELGHAVSYTHFNSSQMQQWNQMRGLSSWRWVPGTPNDFSVGEGDFAEAFMSYLIGHPVRSVGGPVTSSVSTWIANNTPF